jgi:hypothetical protein
MSRELNLAFRPGLIAFFTLLWSQTVKNWKVLPKEMRLHTTE